MCVGLVSGRSSSEAEVELFRPTVVFVFVRTPLVNVLDQVEPKPRRPHAEDHRESY